MSFEWTLVLRPGACLGICFRTRCQSFCPGTGSNFLDLRQLPMCSCAAWTTISSAASTPLLHSTSEDAKRSRVAGDWKFARSSSDSARATQLTRPSEPSLFRTSAKATLSLLDQCFSLFFSEVEGGMARCGSLQLIACQERKKCRKKLISDVANVPRIRIGRLEVWIGYDSGMIRGMIRKPIFFSIWKPSLALFTDPLLISL